MKSSQPTTGAISPDAITGPSATGAGVAPARPEDAQPGYSRRAMHRRREATTAWLMSAPALAGLFVFVVLPLLLGMVWSLTNKRLISPLPTEFIGLENYRLLLSLNVIQLQPELDPVTGLAQLDEAGQPLYPRVRTILKSDPKYTDFQEWFQFGLAGRRYAVIATDPTFMRAVLNTLLFVIVIVPGQGGLALLLALLVNQKLKGIAIFRTIYFAPVVTSMAVIAVVWVFLYNPGEGVINRFLEIVSFGKISNVPWLSDTRTAFPAIWILSAWQAAGFQMVIFLAGLQEIPDSLYEAAQMDGANTLQQLRYVTLPQLRNTTIFVIISTTILAFRLFTQVDVMTRGGPEDSTATVIFHVVNQGFRQQRIGYASAITVVFFAMVVAVALLQRTVLKSEQALE